MPSSVDLEHLEENINGEFMKFLQSGGIDTGNFSELAKIKHNTFEAALTHVYEKLFKPDTTQINNQQSILSYNDLDIFNRLIYIYNKLCELCNKSTGLSGFSSMTGYSEHQLQVWRKDELNPDRMALIEKLQKKRQHIHVNRLQDNIVGDVAVANNAEEAGLMWAQKNTPQIQNNTVYLMPGESIKERLKQEKPAEISKSG